MNVMLCLDVPTNERDVSIMHVPLVMILEPMNVQVLSTVMNILNVEIINALSLQVMVKINALTLMTALHHLRHRK